MKAFVTFLRCEQISQSIGPAGGAESWLAARLHFTMSPLSGGLHYLTTEIRQNHGFDYFNPELPIEVCKPTGTYEGPWHHESFSKAAEDYFRKCVGRRGSISIDENSTVRMENNGIAGNAGSAVRVTNSTGILIKNCNFGDASISDPTAKYSIELPDKAVGPW